MSSPRITDERLRSWLDGQQLAREQLCLAILRLDNRFTEVKPRNPRGGPDGSRDIEAVFNMAKVAWVAVGFFNSVSDSASDLRKARAKFKADLTASLEQNPTLRVFVFFTNVALTTSARDECKRLGQEAHVEMVEVYDRERMRIALDSADGLAIRYQYLQIALSDAEQAAFFSRWGSSIETLITKSVSSMERRLARLEFVAERNRPLTLLGCRAYLRKPIPLGNLGHFRFEWYFHLAPPKPNVVSIHLAVCSDRGGIEGLDEKRSDSASLIVWVEDSKRQKTILSRGQFGLPSEIESVGAFQSESFMRSDISGLILADLDGGMFAFHATERLASEIDSIELLGNEYVLHHLTAADIYVENRNCRTDWPLSFTDDELSQQKFVRVWSKLGLQRFDFSDRTPLRMFDATEIERSTRR